MPLTAETHHLFNADTLALMRPHAALVNTSRGGVVSQAALVRGARRRPARSPAALDVFEQEPLPADEPAAGPDNVILTPHEAANSPQSGGDLRRAVYGATVEWLRTGWTDSIVNPQVRAARPGSTGPLMARRVLAQDGEIILREVPDPELGPGDVLVRPRYSVISPGTERSIVRATRHQRRGGARVPERRVRLAPVRSPPCEGRPGCRGCRPTTRPPLGTAWPARSSRSARTCSDLRPGDLVACSRQPVRVPLRAGRRARAT